MRNAQIKRETKETIIDLILELDGQGNANISTGVGFLDHMMELFVKHAKFDCNLICKGDIQVDDHHSVEDIAICLGKALGEALPGHNCHRQTVFQSFPADGFVQLGIVHGVHSVAPFRK